MRPPTAEEQRSWGCRGAQPPLKIPPCMSEPLALLPRQWHVAASAALTGCCRGCDGFEHPERPLSTGSCHPTAGLAQPVVAGPDIPHGRCSLHRSLAHSGGLPRDATGAAEQRILPTSAQTTVRRSTHHTKLPPSSGTAPASPLAVGCPAHARPQCSSRSTRYEPQRAVWVAARGAGRQNTGGTCNRAQREQLELTHRAAPPGALQWRSRFAILDG